MSAGDPCLVRAAVLEACGQPPRIEELVLDAPAAGEVLVRLEASGVCHSDLHQADGDWGETGPMVLGHEGCGVVTAIGIVRWLFISSLSLMASPSSAFTWRK